MNCKRCGQYMATGNSYGLCWSCKQQAEIPIQYGWVCPKCGAVHSPNTATCSCVPPKVTCCGVKSKLVEKGHYREKHGTAAAIENGLRMHYEYAQQADKCDEWKRLTEILYRCAQWPSVDIPKDAVKWFEDE